MPARREGLYPHPKETHRRVNMEHKIAVQNSLTRFAEQANEDTIATIFASYRKEGVPLAAGRPVIAPYWYTFGNMQRKSFDTDRGQGSFEMDGPYGFGLGYHIEGDDQPVWFAVITFASYGRAKDASADGPYIGQIQGMSQKLTYYHDKEKRKKAARVLSCFAWERAAVGLVMRWAETGRQPAVHIAKGSVVRVGAGVCLTEEQAFNRYDRTALNMGFVYNEETRIYVFDLQQKGLTESV